MSFFSKLFGQSSPPLKSEPDRSEPVSYQGLEIQAAPVLAEGQWRLAGFISRISDDQKEERQFMRADVFASREDAVEYSIRKGRQIIDERGNRLFAGDDPNGRI